MKKKTVIITGGGQGIGRFTAGYLLKKGMNVVIADIDGEAGREAIKGKKNIKFIRTDVADEVSVEALVAGALAEFGDIHALVNNAGIGINKPVTELSLSEWNRVIGTNLTGAFLCAKHAAPYLKKSKGAIVNMASTRAFMSEPDTEAYSASKGGIVALTHAMAVSLGPDIRVNCISPGWIEAGDLKKRSVRQELKLSAADHKQHPAGRVGKPGDISSMIYYLISGDAGFITGANFMIDGGMTKKMIYV
jgi:NAD(P)-dependent dehydrogenase (short-subunit alcohol dehydrogenase family)